MIEVEMIDDIRKSESKAVGPFTLRQVICIVIAISYAVPIAIILPIDITFKVLIGFLLAFPVVMCGWVTLNKEPFEVVLMRYVYKHFLTPRKRKCKVISPYKKALKKVRSEQEQERIQAMSVIERKEYEKKMKKGKIITYSSEPDYKIYR